MLNIFALALAGQHQDTHLPVESEQLADQRKTLIRGMRERRQTEINKGNNRLGFGRLQQGFGFVAGCRSLDTVFIIQRQRQCFDNQWIIVNQQQPRPVRRCRRTHRFAA